ncbi:MAG: hypothetical protein E7634_03160 [Ruminococcaceae bacterium]|nr:hypothetical protein [Oscillospiraceae bacterium]
MKRRFLCLIIAAAIMLGCFSGCGVVKGDTVMEYEGYKITEAMYSYWMARYKTIFLYTYNGSGDQTKFWNTEISEGYTYDKFITEYINFYAKQVLVAMKLFDDYSLVFSENVKQNIKDQVNALIDSYGTKAELNAYLAEYGLNVATLERIYYAQAKLTAVNDHLYGENGISKVTDAERDNYYKANYYCAEWIYVYTKVKLKTNESGDYVTDSNGVYVTEELTEAEKLAQKQKVDDILEKIGAGEDFKALKAKYSEEDQEKYAYYPDGVNISANDYGTYGAEFIKKLSETELGGITLVEDEYATFIIKRYPLKEFSELTTQEKNIMVDFETYVLDAKSEAYYKAAEVKEFSEVMARFDIREHKGLTNTNI